ncbi:MAG: DUF58 domain-containing protein [Armatimonadetes bacterium]|nr:DUF58 domain-containing protein [Armatimonadota bacterium]
MSRGRWLALVVGVLALSYVLRAGFATFALYVVLWLLLASRLTVGRGLRSLHHRRLCHRRRAKLGELVDVSIELRHEGRWPLPWVMIEDLTPAALPRTGEATRITPLRPGQTVTLRYQLTATRRGYHQIGPLLLETGDLFGLARKFSAGDQAHYLLVHPRIVPIGGYSVATNRPIGEVRAERRIFEDPSRLRGVREYRAGDKLSHVHWRASARAAALQTKVFEPTTMIGALICLDMFIPAFEGRGVDQRSELAVTAAASLASYISSANQRVGFASNGRDAADRARFDPIDFEAGSRSQALRLARMAEQSHRLRPFEVPVGRGPTTLNHILDATARVELSDFQPVGAMLLREYPRLPRDVSVLVLTPRVEQSLVEACSAMRRSGFVVHVFVFGNEASLLRQRGRLLAAGVHSYGIDDDAHLAQLALTRL